MDLDSRLGRARGGLGSSALADLLQNEIEQGLYKIGSNFPSETALRARFGVGRHTAREAVRRLEDAGLVARRQGAPTRVVRSKPKAAYVHSLRSLAEVLQFTRETQLEIAERYLVDLDGADAKLVGATPGSRWLCLRGVRRAVEQNDVICYSTIYVHSRFSAAFADIRVPHGPLYAAIEAQTGEIVQEAEQKISAGALPTEAARSLSLPGGTTGIRVTRRYLDMSGGVMLTAINWHDPAKFSYVISLRRDTTT